MKATAKNKFDSIDKSKINSQATKDLLSKIEKGLNSKVEDNQKRAEDLLDKIISQAKAKKADIFVSKTPAPKQTPTAKKAKAKVTKSKLDDLMDAIKNDPLLADFNSARRVKGGGRSDIEIDAERKARESGVRVSKKGWKNQYGKSKGGRKYYEYRENRIDRKAPSYASKPWLEDGGIIHPSSMHDKFKVVEVMEDGKRKVHNTFADMDTAMTFGALKRNFLKSGSQLFIEDENGKVVYRSFKNGGYMAKGGVVEVSIGDKVKSKSGVDGIVYESTGTMFKLEDKYGNKSPKWHSIKDFRASEIMKKQNSDYTKRRDVKLIVIKNPNKNGSKGYLTIEKKDFLNGLNKFEEGGKLGKDYTYIKRGDVDQVAYYDDKGKTQIDSKPKNGFWVSKKALVDAGMNEVKSSPKVNFGNTSLNKGVNGWKAKTSVKDYKGYDWEITTMKSMRGDLVTTAVGGHSKQHQGYSTFEYVMYQDPNIRLMTSKPARITDKVVEEQHDKALLEFEAKVNEKYAKGGKIENQYEGRTAKDIWDNLSKEQRQHFIYDHQEEIENFRGEENGELRGKEIREAYNSDWSKLDKSIKNRFENHVREGEYAKGGKIGFEGLSKKVAKNYAGKKVAPKYRKEYGETYDKAEAKEVGDKVASKVYRQQLAKMEKGGKLPEDLGKYFIKTSKTKVVKMSDLIPLRARPTGIENASKYMKMAYDGEMDKRKPITIYKSQGKYRVYDGNSTYAVAKANGWENIWAEVIKNPNMKNVPNNGIFAKAKEIRKAGESWQDAVQRAKAMK